MIVTGPNGLGRTVGVEDGAAVGEEVPRAVEVGVSVEIGVAVEVAEGVGVFSSVSKGRGRVPFGVCRMGVGVGAVV